MTIPNTVLPPLSFKPQYKATVWGGQNLKTILAKDIPESGAFGESWELSDFGIDSSMCLTPGFTDFSLRKLLEHYGHELAGSAPASPPFPLLYKFIDAHDRLSVQVHPDDEQARVHEWGDFGKTECWYIVAAKPQAEIIIGVKEGVSVDDVAQGVGNNTLESLLNRIPIRTGDVLFIPAGTVHAILDGTLLYEVQETSNTTFRLYDWGRVDSTGAPRELHISEALQVLDTTYHRQHTIPPVTVEQSNGVTHLFRAACRYFALEEYYFAANTDVPLPPKKSFAVLSALAGAFSLTVNGTSFSYSQGETVLIPATCCAVPIDLSGDAQTRILLSTVPDLKREVIDYLRNLEIADAMILALGGSASHNDLNPLL
jgi:mannose-6-phosphate isomerase